jgi:hypothetical protein
MPRERAAAIAQALADEDERIVTMALTAAQDRCPDAAIPLIVAGLAERRFPPSLRIVAIRTLGATRTPRALDALLQITLIPKRWWRRRRLAKETPECLAALTELARHWPADPQAAVALRLAARSASPDVRAAIAPEALPS